MQSLSSALCIDTLIWCTGYLIKVSSLCLISVPLVVRLTVMPQSLHRKVCRQAVVKQWLTLDVKIYIIRIRTYFIKYMSEIFNRHKMCRAFGFLTERAFQITGTCYFYIYSFEAFNISHKLLIGNILLECSCKLVRTGCWLKAAFNSFHTFDSFVTSMPSTSAATPWVLPEQPPSNLTPVTLLSTTSNSIEREHTPLVVYFIIILISTHSQLIQKCYIDGNALCAFNASEVSKKHLSDYEVVILYHSFCAVFQRI